MALELSHFRRYLSVWFANMVFSDEDKILLDNLYQLMKYKAVELTNEFPSK